MKSGARIIVTGLIAQHPRLGGVTWDYVQYLTGLRSLGHDVYYFEDSGLWPYRFPDEDQDLSGAVNAIYLESVMARFGLAGRWAYRPGSDKRWYGLEATKRNDVIRSADLLINISGTLRRPRDYRRIPVLAYIDSDPVFTQVKAVQGARMRARLDAHDVHYSFGECLESADVPKTPYHWIPTRTPISMEQWPLTAGHRGTFTTVMSWTSYKPLIHEKRSYGQKDIEFERFLDLPARVAPVKLEVATHSFSRHRKWATRGAEHASPIDLLEPCGWKLVESLKVAENIDSYRDYITQSQGEWSVAKNGYVLGRAGWFSCRSACYLAAGRPVVVQDTGFQSVIPSGQGVIAFRDIDEAAAGIREVVGNYVQHSRAAHEIAREYFDAEKVLMRLVDSAFQTRTLTRKGVSAP